jgi:hypothetical protein
MTPGRKHQVSIARRAHILDGDASGGGHRYGTGKGKSEFPKTWTDDEIIDAIEDVANDPTSARKQQVNGNLRISGTRNGVLITVIIEPASGEIVTGYPG